MVEEAKEQVKEPFTSKDKTGKSNVYLLSGPWGHKILDYSSSELAARAFLSWE